MFTLSAFADEISPDPQEQIDVLKPCGVRHIEFRSIHKTNVLNLTDPQIDEFKSLLDREGFKLSAIGSPIGKIRIDEPFEPHLEKFQRAIELCQRVRHAEHPHLQLLPAGRIRRQLGRRTATRSSTACGRRSSSPSASGVQLFHENEHRIYGDSPERVADLFNTDQEPGACRPPTTRPTTSSAATTR